MGVARDERDHLWSFFFASGRNLAATDTNAVVMERHGKEDTRLLYRARILHCTANLQ